jgi:hypothetical protein
MIQAQKIEESVIASTAQTFTLDPNSDIDDGSNTDAQLDAASKKNEESDQPDYSLTQIDGQYNNLH